MEKLWLKQFLAILPRNYNNPTSKIFYYKRRICLKFKCALRRALLPATLTTIIGQGIISNHIIYTLKLYCNCKCKDTTNSTQAQIIYSLILLQINFPTQKKRKTFVLPVEQQFIIKSSLFIFSFLYFVYSLLFNASLGKFSFCFPLCLLVGGFAVDSRQSAENCNRTNRTEKSGLKKLCHQNEKTKIIF